MSGQLKASTESATQIFWDFFGFDKEDFKTLIPLSLSQGVLSLAVPLGVQVLINRILATTLPSQAVWIVFLVTLGIAAAAFLRISQRVIVERIQRRFHTRVVLSAVHDAERSADPRASRYYHDTFIAQKSVSTLMVEGIAIFMQLVFALILLAFYHPFFLAFDLLILVSLRLVVVGPFNHLIETASLESSAKHAVSTFLAQVAAESKKDVSRRSDEVATGYLEARQNHFRLVRMQMIGLAAIHIVGSALLLGIGSFLVIRGQMSLGQLVAAEIVFSMAFVSLEKINKQLESFYDLIAALRKLLPIVSVPKEEADA